jgi:Collagen triple helix repeat (20 copies)
MFTFPLRHISRALITRKAALIVAVPAAAAAIAIPSYSLAASTGPASSWVCVSTSHPGSYYTEYPSNKPTPHACAAGYDLVGVGDPGKTGATGKTGPTGPAGATGPQGTPGPQGSPGATGPAGPQGQVGQDGAPGPQGLEGPAGPTGPAGANGTDGANGADGVDPSSVQLTGTVGGKTYVITCSADMATLADGSAQLQITDCTDTTSG